MIALLIMASICSSNAAFGWMFAMITGRPSTDVFDDWGPSVGECFVYLLCTASSVLDGMRSTDSGLLFPPLVDAEFSVVTDGPQ